ncbi:glucosyltransferase domain-containing protein [Candidatus Saccharibacteria bacterium]|nr:glucosyltransferase domain-containing protein [Candidatus Saccharibacteria bacterium]
MLNWLKTKLNTDKSLLLFCLITTSLFVLAAHAFFFFNLSPSHDYLNEFYTTDVIGWKISIGRFLSPLINLLLGQFLVSPWLSGLIMIISLAIGTYLIIKMFNLKARWQIILLSGVFSTCLSLTTLIASFMQDLAVDMIALLLAISSAYLWYKLESTFRLKYFLFSIFTLFLSLGCYQGYLSVTIVLIIAKSIQNLIGNQAVSKVLKRGLLGIAVIACGAILFYLTANIVGNLTGYSLSTNTTNSLSNVWTQNQSILGRILSTYLYSVWGIFAPSLAATPQKANLLHLAPDTIQVYVLSIVNILILVFSIVITVRILINKELAPPAKVLCLLLLIITPFAMNITHFLSGTSHILMHYAFVLIFLFLLIFTNHINTTTTPKPLHYFASVVIVLSFLTTIVNIEISNALYVKKDLESTATLATITRALSAIESQDNYILGETKICIIGNPDVQSGIRNHPALSQLFGADYNSSITYQDTYNAYFDKILQYKARLCTPADITTIKSTPDFHSMGSFPNHNYIKTINDTIVVKMSDSL